MPTEVVLFDLGGVLVELGGVGELGSLVGESDEDQIWRRWLSCPWVRRYERGECSRAEFAAGMVERWELDLAPEEFLDRFLRWPRGLFPGAAALVEGIARPLRRACFSNTNELHANHQLDAFRLRELFDAFFFSHEIGLVKPDAEAFEHVVQQLGCGSDRILFLDDNQLNVDGARHVGLDAHRVRGVAEARLLLDERGLL